MSDTQEPESQPEVEPLQPEHTQANTQSWTTKYRPTTLRDIAGNTNAIREGIKFLKEYRLDRNPTSKKHPNAILVSGPGGCGKTTFARLLALYRGFIPIEMSAASVRKKDEVSQFMDLYVSDIRTNFGENHPYVLEARKQLKLCHTELPLGKAMILDELDAMGKSEKGLNTAILEILKAPTHDPDRILIMTCDVDTLTKMKTMANWCYVVQFKSIVDSEQLKTIDYVCNIEGITLRPEDKQRFVAYANGDGRRLLNGMELCFKNGVGEYDADQLSEMIRLFVSNDEATVSKLKFSCMSAEKILGTVINAVCEPIRNSIVLDDAPRKSKLPFKMLAAIETDMNVIPLQLFHSYPSLIRQDITLIDQLTMIRDASEDMSYASVLHDNFCDSNPGIMSEDNDDGEGETGSRPSDSYLIMSVISPLYKLRNSIAKTYRLNASGYAKMYGVKSSMDGQLRIPIRCGEISPYTYNRSMDYLRYFASKLAILVKDKKFDELIEFFNEHHIEPMALIEELLKLKTLNLDDEEPRFLGTNLADVWKTTVKRDFTKEFSKRKPKTQGVKFIDAANQPEKKKIKFFEKYM